MNSKPKNYKFYLLSILYTLPIISLISIYHSPTIYHQILHILALLTTTLGFYSVLLDLKTAIWNYTNCILIVTFVQVVFYVIFQASGYATQIFQLAYEEMDTSDSYETVVFFGSVIYWVVLGVNLISQFCAYFVALEYVKMVCVEELPVKGQCVDEGKDSLESDAFLQTEE